MVRSVRPVVKIHRYVKVIDNLLVTKYLDVQIMLFENLLEILLDLFRLWSADISEHGKAIVPVQAEVFRVVLFSDEGL